MERTPVTPTLRDFPEEFHPLLTGPVYDSSCSQAARVWFLDREDGFYLKSAPKDTLQTEANMTRYFHSKGLGAEVVCYLSDEKDWLLTRQVPGEDCTHRQYLEDAKRLCDTTATLLRRLHETDHTGCPVTNRNDTYFATAQRNYQAGRFDAALFPESWRCGSAEECWQLIQANRTYLKPDTLLHGDYCLPNILLDNWRFSGFIDLDSSGVGDRHIDIFWGVWTLFFNLKTNAYYDRFLDAYGRDAVEPEMLRTIAAFEVFG